MIDKKVSDALQAFENCKFEDCLRLSEQFLKKLNKAEGKKKQNISEDELNLLYITRIGSLAATGHIDQANQLIKSKFDNPIVSVQSFLFLQICTMAMDDRIGQFTNIIETKKEKKKIDINRFVLLNRDFSGLARIFLKKYMQEKNHEDSLKQIYLQYLQQLENNSLISYERNKIIPECKEMNLQIISMFLQKYIKNLSEIQKNQQNKREEIIAGKVSKSVKNLKIRIALHGGKAQAARNIYKQIINQPLCYPYPYLRSIKQLTDQKEENRAFWAKQYLQIFTQNLDLDQYKPIYEYNCEFIDHLLAQIGEDVQKMEKPAVLEKQMFYQYFGEPLIQLQNYYNSLFSQIKLYIQEEQTKKKKDFYVISLKNLILQFIKISYAAKQFEQSREYLLIFRDNFGKKLTFPDQIEAYLFQPLIFDAKFIQKYKQQWETIWKPDDKLIWKINVERLFPSIDENQQDLTKMFAKWDRYYQLYRENLIEVEEQKHLEKGQRYLSDEFLVISADSVQLYTQKNESLSDKVREDCYFYIVSKLESAIQISPYNADLKLRAIYFFNKLNYNEKIVGLCESMDIKAVQFQTIGFLYLKSIISSSLFQTQEALLIRMVRSYQQNFRESSEYAYKAIKYLSFDECQQNLSYHRNMDKSYNLLILLYVLHLKNKGKGNSKFYLQQILKRLTRNKGQLSFNCDFRVFKNKLSAYSPIIYSDFYGVFNNHHIFENQCKLQLAFLNLSDSEKLNLEDLKYNWESKDPFSFGQYNYFERNLKYEYSGKLFTEKTMKLDIQNYNKITEIRVRILQFLNEIKKSDIEGLKNSLSHLDQKLKQYSIFLSELTWRNQTRFNSSARSYISQVIPYISNIAQQISNNKKKIQKSGERKQMCLSLLSTLVDSVNDNVKWGEMLKIQKQYTSQSLIKQQELLDRMSKMSSYEFKKNYKIKL